MRSQRASHPDAEGARRRDRAPHRHRGAIARRDGRGGAGEPCQVALPREHESRVAHAAERDHRLLRDHVDAGVIGQGNQATEYAAGTSMQRRPQNLLGSAERHPRHGTHRLRHRHADRERAVPLRRSLLDGSVEEVLPEGQAGAAAQKPVTVDHSAVDHVLWVRVRRQQRLRQFVVEPAVECREVHPTARTRASTSAWQSRYDERHRHPGVGQRHRHPVRQARDHHGAVRPGGKRLRTPAWRRRPGASDRENRWLQMHGRRFVLQSESRAKARTARIHLPSERVMLTPPVRTPQRLAARETALSALVRVRNVTAVNPIVKRSFYRTLSVENWINPRTQASTDQKHLREQMTATFVGWG